MKYDFVIVSGDIHDKYNEVLDFINKYDIKNAAIIIAGDFGIGFEHPLAENSKLKKFNTKLKESSTTVFVVRGNHDDPSYFYGERYNKSHIKFVSDYSVLNINDINILCVGGAVSIDRTSRKRYTEGRGRDWWFDETFKLDLEKIKTLKNIDIVITHSSPSFAYPYVKNEFDDWFKKDEFLKNDVESERNDIATLYNNLVKNNNIKKWYYGHFHTHNEMYYDNTQFICLSIYDFKEILL
ncbi:metallophosphoesterase [Candidatus Dojkabacteria bacterium]|jgi:DNA repair exonuclease SbcCD nuclease subunit|nr:metallophosphoesterase [Candidatus Dojkabacteria bacterium]